MPMQTGRVAGNVTGGSISKSIFTPCLSRAGAIEDYIRVILKYNIDGYNRGGYAGWGCWSNLPTSIQKLHRAHVFDLLAKSDTAQYLVPVLLHEFRSTSVGTGGITSPCLTEKGAVEDYRDVVVNYENRPGIRGYAGRNCFELLPRSMQIAHENFVKLVEADINYKKALSG
jgi:hypothetical protein